MKAILLIVKVGYYPLLPLAVLTFYFIYCLLLSIVIYCITYWVHPMFNHMIYSIIVP